jgi:hypothetical protein
MENRKTRTPTERRRTSSEKEDTSNKTRTEDRTGRTGRDYEPERTGRDYEPGRPERNWPERTGRDYEPERHRIDHTGGLTSLTYDELCTKADEIETALANAKAELAYSYKKSLANLKQFEIDRSNRVRIIKDSFTASGSAIALGQSLDLQILDVFNENTFLDQDGELRSQSGLWIKIDSPELEGFDIIDVQQQNVYTWVEATDQYDSGGVQGGGAGLNHHTMLVDSDDYLYMIGGASRQYLKNVWKSEDDGVTWSRVCSDAFGDTAKRSHASVIDGSDKMYVFGGYAGVAGFYDEIWYSNTNGASWEEQSVIGGHWSARAELGAVITSGGRIYVFGGCEDYDTPTTVLNDVWYSNDGGETWTECSYGAGEVWSARRGFAYCIDSNDRIFVIGGEDTNREKLNDVWYTDDPTDKWHESNASAVWEERTGARAVVDSYDNIYLIGGERNIESDEYYQTLNDVYICTDGVGYAWGAISTVAGFTRRAWFGLGITSDDNIFITGGKSDYPDHSYNVRLSDVLYKLGSVTKKWLNTMIEIYKPNYSDSSNIFYEISGIYDVDDTDDKYIYPSNCYLKRQNLYEGSTRSSRGDKQEVWVEDAYLTHDFRSDDYNKGRIFIKTDITKGKELPSLIITNRHFEGTGIAGLSQADYRNIIYLSQENGKIYSLQNQGNIIKTIQEHKISLVTEDEEVYPFYEDYGTVHPASIIKSPLTGYIYGFDVYKGEPWRDVGKHAHTLSGRTILDDNFVDYKMFTLFKNIGKELLETGDTVGSNDVVSGYDGVNGLVYMSFPNTLDSIDYYTLVFDERQNRWLNYVDITPQMYASGKNNLFSSDGSDLWLHNSDDVDRLNLYGSAKDLIIEVIANRAGNKIKTFNAVQLHASAKFTIDPITIPATDTSTGREMVSKLSQANLKERDGVYVSPLFKNMKTSDTTEKINELLTGENLRGYSLKLRMTNESTNKVEFFKCDILSEVNY